MMHRGLFVYFKVLFAQPDRMFERLLIGYMLASIADRYSYDANILMIQNDKIRLLKILKQFLSVLNYSPKTLLISI